MTVKELREELDKHPDWMTVTDTDGTEIDRVRPWLGDLRMVTIHVY